MTEKKNTKQNKLFAMLKGVFHLRLIISSLPFKDILCVSDRLFRRCTQALGDFQSLFRPSKQQGRKDNYLSVDSGITMCSWRIGLQMLSS